MATPVNINPKGILAVIALLIIGSLGAVILSQCIYTVQFGSVGLLTRFGKITGEAQEPGAHFKLPFIDEILYYRTQKIVYETLSSEQTGYYNTATDNTALGDYDYSFSDQAKDAGGQLPIYQDISVDTTTKDGQQVFIRFNVRFSLNPDQIVEIANTLGTEADVVDKIVKTDSRIWARNIPKNYTALDLYTGNVEAVSTEIEDKLRPTFEENGLILDEFAIRAINFQDEYVNIIEQKQIEKEKIATEEYIAQQELFKKQAAITKAEGEAEAQRLQQQTLTNEIIKKMWIEKWNGQLPTTMAGESSGVFLNVQ